MEEINLIYRNSFGIAFQWAQNSVNDKKKVQLVFRDTGLLITKKELMQFQKNIKCTMKSNSLCKDCQQNESCRALLLDTPASQVTLAMNQKELQDVSDLVEGTLFQLNLDNHLNSMFNK